MVGKLVARANCIILSDLRPRALRFETAPQADPRGIHEETARVEGVGFEPVHADGCTLVPKSEHGADDTIQTNWVLSEESRLTV